jgi:hypothetical protein
VRVDVTRERERFEMAAFRDVDTIRIEPGLQFSPRGRMTGRASVGYRRSSAVQPGLQDFAGITAAVDLQYRIRESTRLTFSTDRDLGQSYRLDLPHYEMTALGGGFVQDFWHRCRVHGRLLSERYDFGANESALAVAGGVAPLETARTAGLGIGYRLPRRSGVDFTVDQFQRRSNLSLRRRVDGVRFGLTVTYGI